TRLVNEAEEQNATARVDNEEPR
ncbi:MAG: hypothetical protein K0R85_1081, partial [Devosia sp.]|nr:hypothetical protein [Devosia sp.]